MPYDRAAMQHLQLCSAHIALGALRVPSTLLDTATHTFARANQRELLGARMAPHTGSKLRIRTSQAPNYYRASDCEATMPQQATHAETPRHDMLWDAPPLLLQIYGTATRVRARSAQPRVHLWHQAAECQPTGKMR